MRVDVEETVAKGRWVFLPIGLCALMAIGAHAAADVMSDRVLWAVDHVDALFDALFSRWSVTAPLVDLVGIPQRTWVARSLALLWELAADWLLALPLLDYQERVAADELQRARALLRRPSARLLRAVPALPVVLAGARAVARLLQSSLLQFPQFSRLCAVVLLTLLCAILAPRALFRSLEVAAAKRKVALSFVELAVLIPLAICAVLSL